MTGFDPEQDHGFVVPPLNGACYYQNGRHYDHDHNEVDPMTGTILAKAPAKPAPAAKPKVSKTTRPRASERRAALTTESFAAESKSEGNGAIDLRAWADGKEKAPFFSVRAAVAKEFGKEPGNAAEARAIILGE